MNIRDRKPESHHVVIIGGGFGGLYAALALGRAPVRITMVDRENHHLFQPLLYQVATGGLALEDITSPLRSVLSCQKNTRVLQAEVTGFDPHARRVLLKDGGSIGYDTLIVAAGAVDRYFGNRHWAQAAPGMKSGWDALELRDRIFQAFEQAEWAQDERERQRFMTFAIVGGGPTGVELAGALAELAHHTLPGDFRNIRTRDARIVLLEAGSRVLAAFPQRLSLEAERSLRTLGVTVYTGATVEHIEPGRVVFRREAAVHEIAAETIIWAAGVKASPLASALAEATGAELDRQGRLIVAPDLSVPGWPEILVIGDMAHFAHGLKSPLPGIAPVAIQQARYAARLIQARMDGRVLPVFRYRDRGMMAVIGRHRAVVNTPVLRFGGPLAWFVWLFLHVMYLVEFENRLVVLVQWAWNYFTRRRGGRLILRMEQRKKLQTASRETVESQAAGSDRQPVSGNPTSELLRS
ncbi:MAG: NAD(P)/FAD-dependent oxidoreductase [Armatimonadota bacterium]